MGLKSICELVEYLGERFSEIRVFGIKLAHIFSIQLTFFLLQFSYYSNAEQIEPYTKLSTVKAPSSPIPNSWGAYKTDEYTGSFTYQYPISVPEGINGLSPSININYNSHLANGMPGWIGAGWETDAYAYVQRDINYTRVDSTDDKYELHWFGTKFELIQVSEHGSGDGIEYKANYGERFVLIKRFTHANESMDRWLIETVDGRAYRFNDVLEVNSSDNNVEFPWRWSLTEVENFDGGKINYYYENDQNINDEGTVYLTKIEYLNKSIEFDYESRPDSYLFVEQGSEIQYGRRLSKISVTDGFPEKHVIAKYDLEYELNESQSRSLLSEVVYSGNENAVGDELPLRTKFQYQGNTKRFSGERSWDVRGVIEGEPLREVDGDSDLISDIVDLTGDGLPDWVFYDDSDDEWIVYENLGTEEQFSFSPRIWRNISHPLRQVKNDGDVHETLSDMNKDGYPDFVHEVGSTMVVIFNDEGQAWGDTDNTTWEKPSNSEDDIREIDVSGSDTYVVQDFLDINGNGYPDLVKAGNNKLFVWRGTKTGFTRLEEWDFPEDHIGKTEGTDLEAGLFDINGDGLPDFVDANGSNWAIYINTGSGFRYTGSTVEVGPNIINTLSSGDVNRQLMDINGDGLVDYVDADDERVEVRLNAGNRFGQELIWEIGGDPLSSNLLRKSKSNGTQVVRDYIDINGDRLPDIVYVVSSGIKVRFNRSEGANLLVGISTPYGGKTDIQYESTRELNSSRLPFSQMVVSQIEEHNGMSNDHSVITTKKYSYGGAKYEFGDDEFRGFSTVSIKNGDQVKKTLFEQGDDLKGRVSQLSVYDDNLEDTLVTEFIEYKVREADLFQGRHVNVYLDEVVKRVHAEGGDITSVVDYRTDQFGNITGEEYSGDQSIEGDERYIKRDYSENSNLVCLEQVFDKRIGGIPYKRTENFYNGSSRLCQQGNKEGLLTRSQVSVFKDGAAFKYNWKHDSLGRVREYRNSNGFNTDYTYEHSWSTKPASISTIASATRHTTVLKYDSYGNTIFEKNPAGFETRFLFDKFYRPSAIIKPGDNQASPTEKWSYGIDGVAPERVTHYRKFSKSNTSPPTYYKKISLVDGYGRVIQGKTPYGTINGSQVVENTYYDVFWRVSKVDNPIVRSASEDYDLGAVDSSNNGTKFLYDALDRLTNTVDPEGHQQINSYSGLKVKTFFRPAGSSLTVPKKHYRFDTYNQLRQLDELDSDGSILKTSMYSYSPLGDMVSIVGQNQNTWLYQYDQLSNLTGFIDPDRGQHTFVHDGEGNLISHTDSKGVAVTRSYDSLNRVTSINYPSDFSPRFIYDLGTLGTLSSVSNELGITTFEYDERLRKTKEVVELDGLSWTTKWLYDSADNVLEMIDPELKSTLYTYGNDARLISISGVASNIEYSTLGQYSKIQYANDTEVSRLFNSQTLKLENIQSRAASGGLSERLFKYDPIGNISRIDDSHFGISEYGYDNLDQLTSVTKGDSTKVFGYDALGNIKSILGAGKNVTYSHNQSKIHQISQVESVPNIAYLEINSGDPTTTIKDVVINIFAYGEPSELIVSEESDFSGANWQSFNNLIEYSFDAYGEKTLFVKVKNNRGISETRSVVVNYVQPDADGDNVSDDVDNCPNAFNPNQLDIDNDGIGDACDTDIDGDGLPNEWEIEHGLNPENASDAAEDSDGDGYSNLDEYRAGSDPNDPASTPNNLDFLPAIYNLLLSMNFLTDHLQLSTLKNALGGYHE